MTATHCVPDTRRERAKRLRPDGNDQYIELKGTFARLLEDPYTPRAERPARRDHVTMTFVGGGFAGLVTAARLKDAGVDDVRIVEKGGGFGGTWYWNRYPGAQCDTASMIYLPLLEETGYMPSERYAHAPEIREHCDRIASRYGLHESALFHTEVTDLEWDAGSARWIVRTSRGDEFTSQFVGIGTGPLHVAKLPGIPGIETFAGHSFHTSRWDYAYTGGDPDGAPLDRLADKRVAIIGTGATAVQCVPHLARACQELFVVQRTPSSVDVRANQPIDPGWFAGVATPGWQDRWLANFVANMSAAESPAEDLVNDGWTDLAKRIRGRLAAPRAAAASFEDLLADFENADFEKMSEIRARVDAIVEDRDTADRLKAWYRQLCKRPCFHDEYLAAFNRPGRPPRRHRRKGRRTHHRGRRRGRRCRVPGRLHHLRLGLRGRHGADQALRLRRDRQGRRQAVGVLVRGNAHAARHPRAPIPQRLPGSARPGRQLHRQRPAQSDRRREDDRGDRHPHAGPRLRSGRRDQDRQRMPGWSSWRPIR